MLCTMKCKININQCRYNIIIKIIVNLYILSHYVLVCHNVNVNIFCPCNRSSNTVHHLELYNRVVRRLFYLKQFFILLIFISIGQLSLDSVKLFDNNYIRDSLWNQTILYEIVSTDFQYTDIGRALPAMKTLFSWHLYQH